MKLLKNFKKFIWALLVAVVICSASVYMPCAAGKVNQDEDYGVSPCYSYTSYATTTLTISSGDAICKTYVEGVSTSITKITITQTLQRKSGSSWVDVWSWTNTQNSWYYNYTNYHYPLTKGATYRVKSYIKVYSGSSYESIYSYSSEKTY